MDGDKNGVVVYDNKKHLFIGRRIKKFTHRFKRLKGKKYLLIIVLALVLALGYKIYNDSKISKQERIKLYSEIAPNLYPAQVTRLKIYADRIQVRKDYKKDPNLLYAVTMYYMYTSDLENAQKNYDLLKKAYDDKKGFDSSFNKSGASIKTAENSIKFLKEYKEALKNYVKTF